MTQTQVGGVSIPTGTPAEVADRVAYQREPPRPVTDSTLGILVSGTPLFSRSPSETPPTNRLVAIGDSLSLGVQSGAAFATDLSFPAIIAHELGWSQFRYPQYAGSGGLPINIELLLRSLEQHFGSRIDFWEVPSALFALRTWLDQLEDYWERGPGSVIPSVRSYNHALAMYGWDVRDVLSKTAASCLAAIGTPKDNSLNQFVENHHDRAALRVYPTWSPTSQTMTLLDVAKALGEEGGADRAGIETLIVFVGANNCLRTVTELRCAWSGSRYQDLAVKRQFTVWQPEHFRIEYRELADKLAAIRASHVILCTIPHVTIAPLARGIGGKLRPGSRYFKAYGRPWINEHRFRPKRDPHFTGEEARTIDGAIDAYNAEIANCVRKARQAGRDWHLLDIAGMLDRLASRRFLEDHPAVPSWWTPYPMPESLARLQPAPSTRFLAADEAGNRTAGGLFSLDGIHPTTVGYGLIAQEAISLMRRAGVQFKTPAGELRPDPVRVDFERLIRRDTLLRRPPRLADDALGTLNWADEAVNLVRRAVPL